MRSRWRLADLLAISEQQLTKDFIMKIDLKNIRAAILKNRGGFENANDSQIMLIWTALDNETKKAYLESVNDTKIKDKTECQ